MYKEILNKKRSLFNGMDVGLFDRLLASRYIFEQSRGEEFVNRQTPVEPVPWPIGIVRQYLTDRVRHECFGAGLLIRDGEGKITHFPLTLIEGNPQAIAAAVMEVYLKEAGSEYTPATVPNLAQVAKGRLEENRRHITAQRKPNQTPLANTKIMNEGPHP